jgi:hypothetical protein
MQGQIQANASLSKLLHTDNGKSIDGAALLGDKLQAVRQNADALVQAEITLPGRCQFMLHWFVISILSMQLHWFFVSVTVAMEAQYF